MEKIKIGIPRAFLFYKYQYLWERFFKELGCKVILSPKTNKEILKDGINFSIDESCLSAKVYMGHVFWLKEKVDYILVPRIVSFGKREVVCVKFNAMYDIVRNTFPNIKILDYNIDYEKGENEFKAFLKMGLFLRCGVLKTTKAYFLAKKYEKKKKEEFMLEQEKLIEETDNLKIMIVSHPYNTYDELLGKLIIKYLESLGVTLIYADLIGDIECESLIKDVTRSLYWTYNKELISAICKYQDKIDGIILVSTFPCGPDSLVNEICLRKIKNIPLTVIVLDELQGEAGLHTRLESFIDIIKNKKTLEEKV